MANEKRLIAVDSLKKEQKNILFMGRNAGKMRTMLNDIVTQMIAVCPTVDAVEVVHGYWIERPLDNFRKYEVKCSECGFIGIGNYDQYLEPCDFRYCPNCGAKMDGGNEDG